MYNAIACNKQAELRTRAAISFEKLDWRPLDETDLAFFHRFPDPYLIRSWRASDDLRDTQWPTQFESAMEIITVTFRAGARQVLQLARGLGSPIKRAFDYAEDALKAVPELGERAA